MDRDGPKDGERLLKHQHSASLDHCRALIPMWDSSDPDRAPPPLPLNPQSPSVSPRRGTSSAIQSAHAALAERARDSSGASASPTKRAGEGSGEKSLIRGSHHRRMESFQAGSVRDLGLLLENGQHSSPASPTKSPEKPLRPSTPSRTTEPMIDLTNLEQEPKERNASPTLGPSLTPIIRPIVRRPPQNILGENAPPQSATMQALQSMPAHAAKDADAPLQTVTNGSTALTRIPPGLESLSNQILSLTSIATALQKDMSQLSRRSRDNAADLLSLREATKTRDEDIRRSLRDVLTNVHDTMSHPTARDPYGAGLFLDHKPHQASTSPLAKAIRPLSLPRIPSPNSFTASTDRDSITTPSLCSADSTVATTILEKMARDMSTKEGQNQLLTRLSELADRLAGLASAARVEELIRQTEKRTEKALASNNTGGRSGPHGPSLDFDRDSKGPGNDHESQAIPLNQRGDMLIHRDIARQSPTSIVNGKDVLGDDVVKTIRSMKDSVSQSGGLTAEVKALVRELRGEVLGMGRQIGRRLDEMDKLRISSNEEPDNDDISKIVGEGLAQMKVQMDDVVREHRRASASPRSNPIDYHEIYNAMRAALRDADASKPSERALNREDVLDAVKNAWESYKPEASSRDLGLDNDEVLEYLKQGLQEYVQAQETTPGATREEVFQAVVEGLKHFVPPPVESATTLSRDEILDAVRECLEEFEFPVAPSALNAELTRDDMVLAVKEGLSSLELPPQNQTHATASADYEEMTSHLRQMMDYMRLEFQAVSEEAKQNVAANGRDTEQVLDATKDGLEKLRADIEESMSQILNMPALHRPAGDQAEALALTRSFDLFRTEIAALVAQATEDSRTVIEERMDSLQDTVNSSMVPATPQVKHGEILEAVKAGLDAVRAEMQRPSVGHVEILDALHDGLTDLRISIDKFTNRPVDLTANDEILDALKTGLGSVRSDIESMREQSREDRALATMNDSAVVPAEPNNMLCHDDIKNLEVLITQLRIKVETLASDSADLTSHHAVSKEDLTRLEDLLSTVQESVIKGSPRNDTENSSGTDNATKEDVEAVETILRNAKAKLDDLVGGDQAVKKDHVDNLEKLLGQAHAAIENVDKHLGSMPQKDDVAAVQSLLADVAANLDDLKTLAAKQSEHDLHRVTKADIEAVEAACLDVKSNVEQTIKDDLAILASGDDIRTVNATLTSVVERLESLDKTQSEASIDRRAEIIGIGEQVSDVKTLLSQFQTHVQGKLEDEATGIEALGTLLEGVSDAVGKNTTLGQDLKDLSSVIKAELGESKADSASAKITAEENFRRITDTLAAKIDEGLTELGTKHTALQTVIEERAKVAEARDAEAETALTNSKIAAEELKTLVDTLGSSVTDSLEKVEEVSKTVFNQVEEMTTKAEAHHTHGTSEHEQTRERINHSMESFEVLRGQIGDYQPKILEAVQDVLSVVGQHYEYTKSSTTDLQGKMEENKSKAELPMLLPAEKYDDSNVHEKLDRIVGYTDVAGQAFSQFDILDKVHQQVKATAAEISDFLAGQTKQITESAEDKEKALQETNIALERQLAQKEGMEKTLQRLHAEEDMLNGSIAQLRAEQESMLKQKTRLTADVSSLETALRLRREELSEMEDRAQGLERRILDGVMDHSRVLLMSKAAKTQDTMSRKRVRNQKQERGSNIDETRQPPLAVNLALAAKRNLAPPMQQGPARRILSLSQINNNTPSSGVSRSQSVRTQTGAGRSLRKSSWGGGFNKGSVDGDKENESVREVDEDTPPRTNGLECNVLPAISDVTMDSDAGVWATTDALRRRSSHGTTIVTDNVVGSVTEEDEELDTGDPLAFDGQVVRYGERIET